MSACSKRISMASQGSRETYEKGSVIRGHHVYKTVWTLFIGEELHHSMYIGTCGSWPRPRHYTTRRLFETRRLLPFFGSSPPATKRGRCLFDAGVYSRKYGTCNHTILIYNVMYIPAIEVCIYIYSMTK